MFMFKNRTLIFLLIVLKLLVVNFILAENINAERLEKRQGPPGPNSILRPSAAVTSTNTDNSDDTPTDIPTRRFNTDISTDTSTDTRRRGSGRTSASTGSTYTIYSSDPYEGFPTCKSASDPECTPSNGQPIIKTITLADEFIPLPSGANSSNVKYTTYIATYTEYIAGHSETLTVTDADGDPTPSVMSYDPSTIIIIRRVTAALLAQETESSKFSTNDVTPGLWGVMISFVVVGFSLIFMIFV